MISGIIIDKTTNEPLPFVHVIALNGGSQAAATSANHLGQFSIAPAGDQVRFTHVGYQSKTLPANQVPFAVQLEPATFEIGTAEVVGTRNPQQPQPEQKWIIIAAVVLLLVIIMIALA